MTIEGIKSLMESVDAAVAETTASPKLRSALAGWRRSGLSWRWWRDERGELRHGWAGGIVKGEN